MRKIDADSLASELARLEALDRDGLVAEWKKINKKAPPANISRILMLRALAYQVQEAVYGGLKKSVREQLYRIANLADGEEPPAPMLGPGTRLLREWHGVTHEVVIEEDGIHYKDRVYGSLSEVAKLITGIKWSGPLFFGLRKRQK